MTLEELELVRKAMRLAETATILGESEAYDTKRCLRANQRAREAWNAVVDLACTHKWEPLGNSKCLKQCTICNTRRVFEEA